MGEGQGEGESFLPLRLPLPHAPSSMSRWTRAIGRKGMGIYRKSYFLSLLLGMRGPYPSPCDDSLSNSPSRKAFLNAEAPWQLLNMTNVCLARLEAFRISGMKLLNSSSE